MTFDVHLDKGGFVQFVCDTPVTKVPSSAVSGPKAASRRRPVQSQPTPFHALPPTMASTSTECVVHRASAVTLYGGTADADVIYLYEQPNLCGLGHGCRIERERPSSI
jgi:hypothetical protein